MALGSGGIQRAGIMVFSRVSLRVFSILTALVIAVWLPGCGGTTRGTGFGNVSGSLENQRGLRIPNAKVEIVETAEETETDSNGNFDLKLGADLDKITLRFSKPAIGLVDQELPVEIDSSRVVVRAVYNEETGELTNRDASGDGAIAETPVDAGSPGATPAPDPGNDGTGSTAPPTSDPDETPLPDPTATPDTSDTGSTPPPSFDQTDDGTPPSTDDQPGDSDDGVLGVAYLIGSNGLVAPAHGLTIVAMSQGGDKKVNTNSSKTGTFAFPLEFGFASESTQIQVRRPPVSTPSTPAGHAFSFFEEKGVECDINLRNSNRSRITLIFEGSQCEKPRLFEEEAAWLAYNQEYEDLMNSQEGTCPADLNGDRFVDGADLKILSQLYGCLVGHGTLGCLQADLNSDGKVTNEDGMILEAFQGPCGDDPPPSFSEGCLLDFNGDGLVNNQDLAELSGAAGSCTPGSSGDCSLFDLNGDGLINEADELIVKAHYGDCPDPLCLDALPPYVETSVPVIARAGEEVTFRAQGPSDVAHIWSFPGGRSGGLLEGAEVTYTFRTAGDYTVIYTAIDACSETRVEHAITVEATSITPPLALR